MIKGIAAILGLLVAVGAIAVIGIAIWPESAGNGDTAKHAGRSTTEVTLPTVTAVGVTPRGEMSKISRPGDKRFALQPVTGTLPVHYRFKHPPIAGILFDVKSGQVGGYGR